MKLNLREARFNHVLLAIALSASLNCIANAQAQAGGTGVEGQIKSLLEMQSEAWNRGDLDQFMSAYQKSEQISYTSSGEITWGYQAIADRYKGKYKPHDAKMGTLRFSELKVSPLGKTSAYCIGRWHLKKEDKSELGGVFTLVLIKDGKNWKIVHDHTSLSKSS